MKALKDLEILGVGVKVLARHVVVDPSVDF
jgi:hypothetical protein